MSYDTSSEITLNQFLNSLALLPIEKIVNAIVIRDEHIAGRLSEFNSKCIEVVSTKPDASLLLRFEDGLVKLSAIDSLTLDIEPDATISGSMESLLRLLLKPPEQRAMADGNIDISGDATLVQDLQHSIESIDYDWQDLLSPILGDIVSNELGEVERKAKDWGKSANRNLQRSIRDFLTEEARVAPGTLEVESFENRLDQLRLKIDRVGAKTELIQRRIDLLT